MEIHHALLLIVYVLVSIGAYIGSISYLRAQFVNHEKKDHAIATFGAILWPVLFLIHLGVRLVTR